MQINLSLRSICFTFLFLIVSNLHAVEPNNDIAFQSNDTFLTQFTFTHENTYYEGKQFIFYANPSFLYMLGTGGISAILLVCGAIWINDTFDKRKHHGTWGNFFTGLGVAGLGAICTEFFFEAISMKIKAVEYIKFDEVGIYQWGTLKAKWEDILAIYLSKTYYNDTPTKTASFSDKRFNDLFVIKDSDKFLPVEFDDFLLISEYYLNNTNPLPIQA